MAVDAYLKLDKIDGECIVKGYEKFMEILSWSWGLSQSGTFHNGPGGGAGKVNVQDISVTKYVDAATPLLVKSVTQGEHHAKGQIVCRKAGGAAALPFITIDLVKVMVTSQQTGGSGGEDRFTENITLNFAEFEFQYQPQDEKGAKQGGAIKFKYDIAKAATA